MNGPARGDLVTVIVPQRERVSARVDNVGQGSFSLFVLQEPRTPTPQLVRGTVYLQFAGPEGVGRMRGSVVREDLHHLLFTSRGEVQLMCRAEALHVNVTAPIAVRQRGGAPVVAETVELSGSGISLTGLFDAELGQHYEFDLQLFPAEPAIHGVFRVRTALPDGRVNATFTDLDAAERGRLLRYVADRPTGRVA